MDPEHGILDINIVARYTDIKGILQLYSLLKLLLVEWRQGSNQEYKRVAQVAEEY
jgi:hypothetical protein